MHDGYYPFKNSTIHYSVGGTGDRLLLCFHGYGESAESFSFLEAPLGKEFTIVALDLPFHGKTEWKEGLFLSPDDLLSILQYITGQIPAVRRGWWLLGYSIGGRVALQILEKCPGNTERLILLAPDGLKVNHWYWLATQTKFGNRFFLWTMKMPGWLFFTLHGANALKLVNVSLYKFAVRNIRDGQVRDNLYKCWTTMRGFRPDLPLIREIIRNQSLPVKMIFGRYDRIISWKTGERFRKKGITDHCSLILADTGHQLLLPRHLDSILSALD